MAKQSGRLVKVGLGIEGTRGAGITPAIWMPHEECALALKVDEARVQSAIGSLADSQDKLILEKYSQGPISGEMRSRSMGYFLYSLLGGYSSAGGSPLWTHTFTLQEGNQHQSLGIVVKDENVDEMYKKAMVASLELSVEIGGLVKYVAEIIAEDPTTSSNTYARTSEQKFSKKHVGIKVAAAVGNLAAASKLDIKSLTLNMNGNAERDSSLGTAQPVDILNKGISIEGALTLNEEDATWRNYMRDGDKKALEIFIENRDVDLGTSEFASLKIQLPLVDFSGWDPDRSLSEIVKQTINFKANFDLTTATLIYLCELKNGQSSY